MVLSDKGMIFFLGSDLFLNPSTFFYQTRPVIRTTEVALILNHQSTFKIPFCHYLITFEITQKSLKVSPYRVSYILCFRFHLYFILVCTSSTKQYDFPNMLNMCNLIEVELSLYMARKRRCYIFHQLLDGGGSTLCGAAGF